MKNTEESTTDALAPPSPDFKEALPKRSGVGHTQVWPMFDDALCNQRKMSRNSCRPVGNFALNR